MKFAALSGSVYGLLLVAGLVLSANASATLIYENAQLEADASGHGNVKIEWSGSDSFSFDLAATVTSIEFDLSIINALIDDVSLDITIGTQAYGDSLLNQSFSAQGNSALVKDAGLDIYTVTLDNLSLLFDAGQEYWISFVSFDTADNSGGFVTPRDVFSVDGDGSHFECNNCTTPGSLDYDSVFRLYGSVATSNSIPEPSSILLMALGLFGACFGRRFRKQ